MGHPDGAHTHGSDGAGAIGLIVAVVAVAVIVSAVAGPVIHAAEVILHVVLVALAVIAGLAVTASAAYAVWRVHAWQANRHRPAGQAAPVLLRAAQAATAPPTGRALNIVDETQPALPTAASQPPTIVNLHLPPGIDAATLAAIIREHTPPREN